MNFRNNTKKQHFISQVEQKLNAINPSAPRDNRKIHAFSIVQRDPPVLSPSRSETIESTLFGHDLFSFDVIDREYRENLEMQFQRYELRVADHSRALLQKLGVGSLDIKEELVEVFAAKLLNMIRNPYSVSKTLNTFGAIERYEPTDPTLNTLLERVTSGSRPHEGEVCAKYGLTSQIYQRWLRVLFMLLGPRGELNMLEDTVARLFNNRHVIVQVSNYSDLDPRNICLLSDRGVGFVSSKDSEVQIAFNLNAKAFAIYQFTDLGMRSPNLHRAITDRLPRKVVIRHNLDDIGHLVAFNRRTIEYAANDVFCGGPCSAPRIVEL